MPPIGEWTTESFQSREEIKNLHQYLGSIRTRQHGPQIPTFLERVDESPRPQRVHFAGGSYQYRFLTSIGIRTIMSLPSDRDRLDGHATRSSRGTSGRTNAARISATGVSSGSRSGRSQCSAADTSVAAG